MAKVDEWLEEIGLERYVELFGANHIDFDVLPDLTELDLAQVGITLGDRKRLMRAIARLKDAGAPPAEPSARPAPAHPTGREAERRQLTVMFCDMVVCTALSARMAKARRPATSTSAATAMAEASSDTKLIATS